MDAQVRITARAPAETARAPCAHPLRGPAKPGL